MYWFNPLAWLAAHRPRVESEGACDDLVLGSGAAAADYAGHLLEIARGLAGRRAAAGLVTMAHRAEIGERLKAILAAKRERGAVTGRKLALCAVVALGCVTALARARTVASGAGQAATHSNKAELSAKPTKVSPKVQVPARVQEDQARFLAGLTAVQGPGVVVTLNDSILHKGASNAQKLISLIHDTDINQVINELKAAGAEAISVNKQRLVTTSPIRSAGPTILVNAVPQPPTYVIRAIGNPVAMRTALNLPGGVASQLRSTDPAMIMVVISKLVVLPAYDGPAEDRYATPVASAGRARAFLVSWRAPEKGVHHLRIEVTDTEGTRMVYDEPCRAGASIQVPIAGEGAGVVCRLYDNGKLVKEEAM